MAEERLTRVYVVDDEPLALGAWKRILSKSEFVVVAFESAEEALTAIAGDSDVDVVVTDWQMPGMSGMELLSRLKADRPDVEVVLMTAHGTSEITVKAIKNGAYDYFPKPFEDWERISLTLRHAAERRRLREESLREPMLHARGPAMREVERMVAASAPSRASVLILGESGTGKEVVARAIHARSLRAQKRFMAVNCSALTETLLESELFGHVRGAFTGADQAKVGLFEAAHGGTIFLDEVGEAPASVQAKLLRVLQEGEVRPVGSTKVATVDVRVLAATNVDLEAAVRSKKFREDLFYRLNVVKIRVPPLRERREDIAPLARYFLARYARDLDRKVHDIAPEALAALEAWAWPGNVRELENAIERALVLGQTARVELADLPDALRGKRAASTSLREIASYAAAKEAALDAFERAYVDDLLERTSGNISEAARLAGLDRSNFKRILRRIGRE